MRRVTIKPALDWYDLIEPRIRKAVRLLRDNGFNTTCSCHHTMEVEGDLGTDGELNRLHHLLFNEGYENYTIKVEMKVSDRWPLWTRFRLHLPKSK